MGRTPLLTRGTRRLHGHEHRDAIATLGASPCVRCGMITCSWCEGCSFPSPVASCSQCDNVGMLCPGCTNNRQWSEVQASQKTNEMEINGLFWFCFYSVLCYFCCYPQWLPDFFHNPRHLVIGYLRWTLFLDMFWMSSHTVARLIRFSLPPSNHGSVDWEKSIASADTPIFHWTMLIGGRLQLAECDVPKLGRSQTSLNLRLFSTENLEMPTWKRKSIAQQTIHCWGLPAAWWVWGFNMFLVLTPREMIQFDDNNIFWRA